ncbi:hypothetical protein DM02DRAFT_609446 [Periconia macrospinosa]|uniref:Uncharacterized protein n=1 Tax=Periconia macrospinosa TaxID=97972 RepID=A0A2V1E8E1_9PLEO|nr:hypothetical protein DM02DRAFT_609446 [Periconia macrospinosa]
MASTSNSSPHPVERSEAPWTVKCETYWMLINLKSLPEGVYDKLEEPLLQHGEFKGGMGFLMVVRYSYTPVGTYDELAIVPGNFTVPQPSGTGLPKIPKKAMRICRIYVSQRTTVYNGRLNWNIAKHLARFKFSAPPTAAGQSPPEKLDIAVYPPGTMEGDGVPPFFACTLQPFKWLPSIPFNAKYLPVESSPAQPPVPAAAGQKEAAAAEIQARDDGSGTINPYNTSPQHEDALLAGTDTWCSFAFEASTPRARGCWVTVHEGATQSGERTDETSKYWPRGLRPWAIGGWLEDAQIYIGPPVEWKL